MQQISMPFNDRIAIVVPNPVIARNLVPALGHHRGREAVLDTGRPFGVSGAKATGYTTPVNFCYMEHRNSC